MTESITESFSSEYFAVRRVAERRRGLLYTSSVLRTATAALADVRAALDHHDIGNAFMAHGEEDVFASRILDACRRAYARDSFNLTADEVGPLALLDAAVSAAADHLGRRLAPTEGPAMANSSAEVAYVTLPRRPETPPWGEDDEAPLVISLGRPDLDAAHAVVSSTGQSRGVYEPGAWEWHFDHKVPGRLFIGGNIRVIAPPPSPAVAAEIGDIAARVLTGEFELSC